MKIISQVIGGRTKKETGFSRVQLNNALSEIKRRSKRRVTDTFKIKVEAFKRHKSQWVQAKIPLMWNVYFAAIENGIFNGVKFAEVFYKIK